MSPRAAGGKAGGKASGRKKSTARKPKSMPAPEHRPLGTHVALLMLRLWTAGFFLVTANYKLIQDHYTISEKIAQFRDQDYVWTIERAIEHPPEVLGVQLTFFANFLRDVMLPYADVLAPSILFFELVLGVCLLIGLCTRFVGTLGFLMMLAFSLAKVLPSWFEAPPGPVGVYLFTVHSANWPVTLILLALVLTAAGRSLGVDALLHRGPRWIRWTA